MHIHDRTLHLPTFSFLSCTCTFSMRGFPSCLQDWELSMVRLMAHGYRILCGTTTTSFRSSFDKLSMQTLGRPMKIASKCQEFKLSLCANMRIFMTWHYILQRLIFFSFLHLHFQLERFFTMLTRLRTIHGEIDGACLLDPMWNNYNKLSVVFWQTLDANPGTSDEDCFQMPRE